MFLILVCGGVYGQANLPLSTTSLSKLSLPTGFSHSGLGTDYAGPTLKFDDLGDYLDLYFTGTPNSLTFDLGVNNTFPGTVPSTATFTVQESNDGVTFSTLGLYSNVAGGTKTLSPATTTKYIRWIYTVKSSGTNISLKNINLTAIAGPTITVAPTTLSGFTASPYSATNEQNFTVSGSLLTNNISIVPPSNYEISLTSLGAFVATNPITLTQSGGNVTSTTIYVRLKAGLAIQNYNGEVINLTSAPAPAKSVTLSGTVARRTITSTTSGDWSSTSTWIGGIVPASEDNVIIATHTVTMDSDTYATRNSGTTTVVNSGGTLATSKTYINNGTTTVNGSFQLNGGGWVSDAVGTNALVYGSNGTLIFNAPYTANSGNYWPTSSGPVNVTVNLSCPLVLDFARTVSGLFQTFTDLKNPGNLIIGTNGTLQLNAGYSFSGSGSPTYGASSLLRYNSGGIPPRSVEWSAATSGSGYPANVQISGITTLEMGTLIAQCSGNLTIDSSSRVNSPTAIMTVVGDVTINGILSLGGDVKVKGNWTVGTGTNNQLNNGKAVFFDGTSGNQTITKTGGGFTFFDYLIIDKSGGDVLLGPSSNLTLNTAIGDVLQLLNVGRLDLRGRALLMNNDGGNILVNGADRAIITTATGAAININGNKTVAGSGTLNIGTGIIVVLNKNLDFGANKTKIEGTLQINQYGYVLNNPPFYASGSLLKYNSNSVYGRGTEWTHNGEGTIGTTVGYPSNVQLSNNVELNYNNGIPLNKAIQGNLTIDSGSYFNMGFGAGASGGVLTVAGNIFNSGIFKLGNTAGDDLVIRGNFTNGASSTFNANDRLVSFTGGLTQSISGATTFDYLLINKSGGTNVTLAAAIIVNKNLVLTAGNIILGSNNLTLPNNISTVTASAISYITASGNGKFIRQGIDGTGDWLFPVGVANSGRYAPITLKNLSGTTEIGVRASTALSPAVSDATRVLKTEWFVSTTNNVTSNIATSWQTPELGSNMGGTLVTGDMGVAIGTMPYSLTDIIFSANSTIGNGIALSNTAVNGVVVGLDNAVRLVNDDCGNAINVVLNAVAISGTNVGATQSLLPIVCDEFEASVANDVWYKFTTEGAGTYSIDLILGTIGDAILDLRSGACNGINIDCSDNSSSTADENITAVLNANTTYFYRIYKFTNGSGTFTTSVKKVPTLTLSETTLTFGNVVTGTNSVSQSFTISGNLLTGAPSNITVTAPASYKVSLDNTTFTSSVLLAYSNETLATNTVYVRFEPSVCASIPGEITFSGGGVVTPPVIAVTGTGFLSPPVANPVTVYATTEFTASWNAILGALSYEIDIYTKAGGISNAIGAANWNFNSTAATNSLSGVTVSAISRGNNNGSSTALTLSTSVSSGYTGASGTNNAAAAALTGNLNPGSGGSTYFQFTLTPSSGGSVTLTDVSFGTRSTGTGPQAYALRSSLDNYASNIASGSILNNKAWSLKSIPALAIQGGQNQAITFRIYGYNGTGGAVPSTANWRIDDLKLNMSAEVSSIVKTYALQNQNVGNVTSYPIPNLIPGTTYYYVVRSNNSGCESVNSNEIAITLPTQIIWTIANVWNNVNGPTIKDNTKVEGNNLLIAATESINTKELVIASGGKIVVKNNGTITINGNMINNNADIIATTSIDEEAEAFFIEDGGSLVQPTSYQNLITGKIKMQRISQLMIQNDYTYWSSPVQNYILKDISPTTSASKFFKWKEDTQAWFSLPSTTNHIMEAGRGYIIRAPGSYGTAGQTTTAHFIGKPNNGIVTMSVKGSPSDLEVDYKWNLIGNPYPSAIDANTFLSLNSSKVAGTLYFWTHNTPINPSTVLGYAPNDYASWNGTGGTGTTAAATSTPETGNNYNIPTGYIAAGQAFFIRGITDGMSTITFNNSMRVDGSLAAGIGKNSQFFRTATETAENPTTTEKHRVWLNLTGAQNAFNQTLVGYVTDATNAYDLRFDGESFGGNKVTFYSVLDTKKLVIQGRGLPFSNLDTVPLGYNTTLTGNLTISIDHIDGLMETQGIYLQDNLLNVVHDLKASNYTFATVPGTFDSRFVLRYSPQEDLSNPTFNDQVKAVKIYKNKTALYANSPYEEIATVAVYDIAGRLIFEERNCNTNRFETTKINAGNQALIIKVTLSNGAVITQKVL